MLVDRKIGVCYPKQLNKQMKKIIPFIIFISFSILCNSQGCGSITKGMLAINKSNLEEAQKHFESASKELEEAESNGETKQTKCYAKYYYGLGHISLQNYEKSEVVDLVEKVALLNEAEKYLLKFFDLSYEDKVFTTRAITDMEAVANRQKGLAIDYYNTADYQSAMRLFEKAIKNKTRLGDNYLDLHAFESAAITSSILGDFEKSLKYIEVLIKNPEMEVNGEKNDQEINLRRKSTYLAGNGDEGKAIACLDSALNIYPKSLSLKKEKLRIYNEVGNLDSVLVLLEDITQEIDNDVQMYTVMGGIYVKKGRLDESYKAYKKALEIDPANKYAIFGLGVYYINKSNEYINSPDTLSDEESNKVIAEQNKNIDKAIFFFNKYLKIEPGDQQCLKTLKQIYEVRGDEEKLEEINKQLATE